MSPYNEGMFIRPCYQRKNGKKHAYGALVESYRTERGPRQRIVSYLGHLRESERLGVRRAAQGKKVSPFKQLESTEFQATLISPVWPPAF